MFSKTWNSPPRRFVRWRSSTVSRGPIRAEIEARNLTQAQVAKLLEIHQPDASLQLGGQLARFSITEMMQLADRLGLAVTLAVGPKIETQRGKGTLGIPVRKNIARRRSTERAAVPHAGRNRAKV